MYIEKRQQMKSLVFEFNLEFEGLSSGTLACPDC